MDGVLYQVASAPTTAPDASLPPKKRGGFQLAVTPKLPSGALEPQPQRGSLTPFGMTACLFNYWRAPA